MPKDDFSSKMIQVVPIGHGIPYRRLTDGRFEITKKAVENAGFLLNDIKWLVTENYPPSERIQRLCRYPNEWTTCGFSHHLVRALVQFWHTLRKKRSVDIYIRRSEAYFIMLVGKWTRLWRSTVWQTYDYNYSFWHVPGHSIWHEPVHKPGAMQIKAELAGKYCCHRASLILMGIHKFRKNKMVAANDRWVIRSISKMIVGTYRDPSWPEGDLDTQK